MSCPPPSARRLFPMSKIRSSQPSSLMGWLLCLLCATFAISISTIPLRAQTVGESRPTPSSFDLPAIGTNRWYSERDFGGRPLVVIHIASWSSATQRMLPLWQQQLQPAAAAGQIHVVAIAHEQHAGRAALLCEETAWPWLLLHDPLLEAIHSSDSIDFPTATLMDAQGHIIQERLTLAELSRQLLSLKPDQATFGSDTTKAAGDDAAVMRDSHAPLLAEFEKRRLESATLDTLQPLADQLLRHAFVTSPEQANTILPIVTSFYREALHNTDDGRWAFRLAVAFRLAFDLSNAAQQPDATHLQRSLDYLELANQSATASPTWQVWLDQYRPAVDQKKVPYAWLANRLRNPWPPSEERSWDPKTLGLPLFDIESQATEVPDHSLGEEPRDWPRSTPVPPASIQIDPVWVNSRSAESHGRWARLYLHVQLKRGDWDLETQPQLEWNPSPAIQSEHSIRSSPQVHATGESAVDGPNLKAPDVTNSVWLELDLWIPADAADGTLLDPQESPRRNARLVFHGRDPLTNQSGWRQAEFYLPAPQRSRVDW